jgi:RNA polymerase sigma factor (sigma-70 family)
MLDEEAIIDGCCKGDRKYQRLLYERYSKKMFVTCLRYSKMQQEAEDILQESFIKVFSKISSFRKECSLESWIKKIVINTALNSQRSKLYLYPMVDVENIRNKNGAELTLADYNFQDLLKLIQTLPTGCQVIFNLFAIEGYQHKEIAEMLNISEGTSKSQYSRAKSLLQEMLLKSETLIYVRSK